MARLVGGGALAHDPIRLYQPGFFQQRRGKAQLPIGIELCVHQPERVAIDLQSHHLGALAKARRRAKVVRDFRVNTVRGQCRQVKALAQLQRRDNARQTPECRDPHEQGGSAGP